MSNINRTNTQKTTIKIVKMGMLIAIAIVLVALIHIPIFPAVPFLEYDPADIPIMIGSFAFGPVAGLIITAITALLQGVTVSAGSGAYGIIMHIIATGVFVLVSGIIYRLNKTKKGALIGIIIGTVSMAVVMMAANMLITPLFMGVPASVVWTLMPFIFAFNLIKAGINGMVTFFLYKRISNFLHN